MFFCEICDRPIEFWKWRLCPICGKKGNLTGIEERKKRIKDKRNNRRISNRFKLRLKNSIAFKAIINYLTNEFEEVPFQKTPDALVVKTISPDRIQLIDLTIPASCFAEYGANNALFILENMDLFNKAFQAIPEGEDLVIRGDKKNIQIELTDALLKFNRSELELDDRDVPVENLRQITYDAKFAICSQDLLNALKLGTLDLSSIVHLNVTPEHNMLEIIASTLELTAQKTIQVRDPDVKKEAKTDYDMNALKHFIEFLTPLNSSLKVEFSTEKPLHLSSVIDTSILINFWLAPRAEEAKDNEL